MSLTIKPVSPAIGAEIKGLDLREPLDAAGRGAILDAFHEYILLLFRGQDLTRISRRRSPRPSANSANARWEPVSSRPRRTPTPAR